jgi:hypothetical protein
MTAEEAKKRIADLFRRLAGARKNQTASLLASTITAGKLYEAWVLANVIKNLVQKEGFSVQFIGGTKLKLKSSPGPINKSFPHFELARGGTVVACIWTDVEFTSLSRWKRAATGAASPGDFHELDIVITEKSAVDRPTPDQIWLGVECKNREKSTKGMLREILGVRRELSYLNSPSLKTHFNIWPMPHVPADPASCLMFFSVDRSPTVEWRTPSQHFGIVFEYLPI